MEIKTVGDLMKALIFNPDFEENVSAHTEFVLFAENEGTACMMDRLELSLNGDCVQLFYEKG